LEAVLTAETAARILIRPAVRPDVADLARVEVETWQDTYAGLIPDRALLSMTDERHRWTWAHYLRSREGREQRAWVAETSGHVVGFGTCGGERTGRMPFAGEVYTLYIHPEAQGLGIGRALVKAMFDRLAEDGMNSAVIWALAANPACHFYSHIGGRLVGERRTRQWGTKLAERAFGWDRFDRLR
jgi:ribosomal protein S18 acetylase RimI-like enzyme